MTASTDSPCLSVCTLDAARTHCTACKRTLAEIAGWGGMSAAERAAVMADLPNRTPAALPDLGTTQMAARRQRRRAG